MSLFLTSLNVNKIQDTDDDGIGVIFSFILSVAVLVCNRGFFCSMSFCDLPVCFKRLHYASIARVLFRSIPVLILFILPIVNRQPLIFMGIDNGGERHVSKERYYNMQRLRVIRFLIHCFNFNSLIIHFRNQDI
jgi:hypothetical protein